MMLGRTLAVYGQPSDANKQIMEAVLNQTLQVLPALGGKKRIARLLL